MVKVSIICLIYKSTKWLQFVYDQVLRHTDLTDKEFFFVANDACEEVLNYLKEQQIPHYVHNNTSEQRKEWYINNVYRAYNYGGQVAKGDYLIFINSDMAFTPDWDTKLLNAITDQSCITSRLVERGIMRSGLYGLEKNFGDNYSNYQEDKFLAYAKEIEEDVIKDSGLYMPLLIKKSHFEQVNYYPEGNYVRGCSLDKPVYAVLGQKCMPGDKVLMTKLKKVGINHKTLFNSIVYHFQEGEKRE